MILSIAHQRRWGLVNRVGLFRRLAARAKRRTFLGRVPRPASVPPRDAHLSKLLTQRKHTHNLCGFYNDFVRLASTLLFFFMPLECSLPAEGSSNSSGGNSFSTNRLVDEMAEGAMLTGTQGYLLEAARVLASPRYLWIRRYASQSSSRESCPTIKLCPTAREAALLDHA